ncbi:MAG TPA: hypothetical protein VGI23_21130 [Steroidobacteraceae bacterium]
MASPSLPPESRDLRTALSALLTELTHRIDCGEPVGELFQEGALLRTPRGDTRGRGPIAELFATSFASRRRSGHISRHSSLDMHVRAIANNRFEVRSLLLAFAMNPADPAGGTLLIGDQIDVVELESDGAYRFVERQLVPALEFSLTPKGKAGH